MATYYAVLPGKEDLAAEVDAPEKRKAVSEYVRFLSNQGLIPYSQRTRYRKMVKVDKMDPGEINTRYKLQYAQPQDVVQEQVVGNVPVQPVRIEEEDVPEDYFQPTAKVDVATPSVKVSPMVPVRQSSLVQTRPTPEPQVSKSVPSGNMRRIPAVVGNSPIALVSRRMGGRS